MCAACDGVVGTCSAQDGRPSGSSAAEPIDGIVHRALHCLVRELTCSKAIVRDVIMISLQSIANKHNCSVAAVLAPYQEGIMEQLFKKDLSSMSPSHQVGNLHSISLLLAHCPTMFSLPGILETRLKQVRRTHCWCSAPIFLSAVIESSVCRVSCLQS